MTDLLLRMGAGDHLVGVSNYDDDRIALGRPKIGDYQNVDWEKLITIRAQLLITQYGADRIPQAISERCAQLGIGMLNVRLDNLDDVLKQAQTVGDALHEHDKASAFVDQTRARLKAVQLRVAGQPAVRTIIVTSEDGHGLAGAGTFLDELLTLAGGENAARNLGNPYPSVDREQMLALSPAVVIQMIPDGQKRPQVVEEANAFWRGLSDLPAVKDDRVYIVTDWWASEPGGHVADLAEIMADLLHPLAKQ